MIGGIVLIIIGILLFKYDERKFDEREAQKDVNELINKGYTKDEAIWFITNAVEKM
jgi:hypothetical protein